MAIHVTFTFINIFTRYYKLAIYVNSIVGLNRSRPVATFHLRRTEIVRVIGSREALTDPRSTQPHAHFSMSVVDSAIINFTTAVP